MVDRAIASLLWWFESTLLHCEAIIKKERGETPLFLHSTCFASEVQFVANKFVLESHTALHILRKFGFLAVQTLMPVWVAISVRFRDYA